MIQLSFVTGNTEKFQIADAVCRPLGVSLRQTTIALDEIQGEDSEYIIRDKAERAFQAVGGPVVVSDDSWSIPGLHGFPGPYMKSIDYWFGSDDFLNLTRSLYDRRIILIQLLAYRDHETTHIIRHEHTGEILTDARGAYGKSLAKVVTMPGDDGLSIAEAYDNGATPTEREVTIGWRDLISWLKSRQTSSK